MLYYLFGWIEGCSDAGVCGPFLITWGFWADAGKPVIAGTQATNPNAYKDCVTDLFCASETIRSYARIFGKDCDGNGIVDCEDFVRIHKMGPGACGSATVYDTPFYKEFAKCKAVVRPQWKFIDCHGWDIPRVPAVVEVSFWLLK